MLPRLNRNSNIYYYKLYFCLIYLEISSIILSETKLLETPATGHLFGPHHHHQQEQDIINLEELIDKIPIDEDQYFEPIPYALSTTYLTHLARNEEALYESIINYKADLEERIRLINKYTKDYESSALRATSTLENYEGDPWDRARLIAAHPINAYRMIRRLSKEFDILAKHIWELNLERELGGIVAGLAGRSGWPREKDHFDTIEAILRLQHIYNFNLTEFVASKFFGKSTNPSIELSPAHTFEIGEYAMSHDYFTLAMDWLQVTEDKIKEYQSMQQQQNASSSSDQVETDDNVNKRKEIEIETEIPDLKIVQNAKWRNKIKHDRDYHWYVTSKSLYLYTDKINNNTSIRNLTSSRDYNYELTKKLSLNQIESLPLESLESIDTEYFNYLALCNGENFQSEKLKSTLYCWYETQAHPYFFINPLKAELLNHEPYLVQIYDFIGSEWIQNLQLAALPTLKRAPDPSYKAATPRTAAYAWLDDFDIPHVPLSRKIELVTGLNVRGEIASTPLQIASYAFGGHVATHYDSLNELDPFDNTIAIKGNRVATFLIYLNDVEVGGLTAFPVLGTSVKPVKGSAVLWYTARRNGARDDRTLHGACPTIVGQKWIATKWIHLHENFLTRPCGLTNE